MEGLQELPYRTKTRWCMSTQHITYMKEENAMPDMNDFHAFKSTSGGSGGGSGGLGCSSGFWVAIVIIGLLTLLGKCSG